MNFEKAYIKHKKNFGGIAILFNLEIVEVIKKGKL
jgi:hypothetical protein